MERTIEVSSGWTTIVASFEMTLPCAVTTRSIWMTDARMKQVMTIVPTVQAMPRATRGIGALTIAVDGDWYSRMIGRVGSPRSATAVLIAVDEIWGERGMSRTLLIQMAVLLSPELA